MAYKQVRDVLERVRLFHQQLSDSYEDAAESAEDDRSRMMWEHLAKREKEVTRSLRRYMRDADDGVLETWLQFAPTEPGWQAIQDTTLDPNMCLDAVNEAAREVNEQLVELYHQLGESTSTPRVQELFKDLAMILEQNDLTYHRGGLGIQEEGGE